MDELDHRFVQQKEGKHLLISTMPSIRKFKPSHNRPTELQKQNQKATQVNSSEKPDFPPPEKKKARQQLRDVCDWETEASTLMLQSI